MDRTAQVALPAGLSDADAARLRENGILVTNETYKQVFTPYLDTKFPYFVTSDSLLNAYHVLYEESICRLEQANARRLQVILAFILDKLSDIEQRIQADCELVAAAK